MPDSAARYPFAEDFAAYEREIDAECMPLAEPPFTVGDRVIVAGAPERGSLTVQVVEAHPRGGFLVQAGSPDGYCVMGPSEHFAKAPPDFVEPPVLPMTIVLTAAGTYEPAPDLAAMPLWETAMRAWLGKFGRAR